MKTTVVFKPFSALIILILLLGGVFTGGVQRASADGSDPWFDVRANQDLVSSWGWPIGDTVTLKVSDQEITSTVVEDPGDQNSTSIFFDLSPIYDIQPREVVSLSNGPITRTTVVTNLEITGFDVDLDTVRGKAAAYSELDVWACDGNGCPNRHVVADGGGVWMADFAHPGSREDEQNTVDIVPGTWGDSSQVDEDGNSTSFGWQVPKPAICAHRTGDPWVYAYNWPLDTLLTLTVHLPDTDPSTDYTETTTAYIPDGWSGPMGTGIFDLNGITELPPEAVLTITGEQLSTTLIIPDFSITNLSVINNTISGTATPGAEVGVFSYNMPGNWWDLYADKSGDWEASPTDPDAFVLVPGAVGVAGEWNEAGDGWSEVDWNVPTSGSATGEGWFSSPAGAYAANTAFEGKATFEFEAKYHEKSAKLTGSVQFSFKGFSFESISLDWMAIEGGRMQLTGSGKVNGKGNYGFMINTASQGGKDTFRIRIWDRATEQVVYDNMPGASDATSPATPIYNGAITIKE